ncbi:MAG TPA: lanthionine synthetase LanC family protein [Actinoplanes sp.]|nr:lanthionine synthetase LanC family protein [Actinoplanes sp.]
MTDYPAQVRSALRAAAIRSPSAYSWFGRTHRLSGPGNGNADLAREQLVAGLQQRLYTDFYCQGTATPGAASAPGRVRVPVRALPLLEALSAANTGTGHREAGWSVRTLHGPTALLARDGLEVLADLGDCVPPTGAAIREGDAVSLRLPKESWSSSPGFYLARSDAGFSPARPSRLVRLYWNVTPTGAVRLVREVTDSLNRAHVPFVLKVWTSLLQASRCDAGVLYADAGDRPAVSAAVGAAYRRLQDQLRPATPAFTKVLAAGLGFAEDAGQGESFGMHRCRLLAEAMVRAHEAGIRSLDGRLAVVADHFAERGVEIDRPYLGEGSPDVYALPVRARRPVRRPRASGSGPEPAGSPWLHTAESIGAQLSRAAVWHGDRCTWLGAVPATGALHPGVTYRTLGPDLYEGTSGVALFLAQLHRVTGEAGARRTALGAIHQSLAQLDRVPAAARSGLYTGWPGVALSAARVAVLLADDRLLDRARGLVDRCVDELGAPVRQAEFDLMSGTAGAIVALLALPEPVRDRRAVDVAVRLGERLLAAAEVSGAGLWWRRASAPRERGLTGLSHGASGAGHALAELFGATGRDEFRTAAEAAFAYERHWFDPARGNWPDFRGELARPRRGRDSFSFSVTWCHGAPGIALSRLRGSQLLGADILRVEAGRAIQTTRQAVRRSLDWPDADFSLCHGLAGNADVLLHGPEVSDALDTAQQVGQLGVNSYGRRGRLWPSGVAGERTPSLMLGLAGIGYFYLRLHDRSTPSVLILSGSRTRTHTPAG